MKKGKERMESQGDEEVLWFENFDLENIHTPVNADQFEKLLIEIGYPTEKTQFIAQGFKKGFSLNFSEPLTETREAPNLKLRVGSKTELWNKLMKEVELKWVAGPFEKAPFKVYRQSPIGLVPKDGGKKTRLIFHLSYPRNGKYVSVNGGIPKDKCSVSYPDFDEAIKLCIAAGMGCKMGKSDLSAAFRHVPMSEGSWALLVMKAECPIDGKIYYFVDKCLPFGSSISCAHFQAISNAIAAIVEFRNGKKTINYLDDFFFAALLQALCDDQLDNFIKVCGEICFPVALDKTFWSSERLVFLGLLIDSVNQVVCLPKEKVEKALEMIDFFLSSKKVTVLQVQKLCGYLNFLCRCITPGRTFIMRLYSLIANDNLKQHHHIKL